MNTSMNRRNFIKKASIGAVGTGMATGISYANNHPDTETEATTIKEYRRFGRTGFQVSDFSSGFPTNESVLKALLKNGINLIDTGEVYMNGNSERIIGNVIHEFDRNKLFINTKLYTETSFPSKEAVIERTNQSLKRLKTDYVDCMMIHSAENSAILKDEAFHAGMEQLKKEGKVRFVGVSCHGNNWAYNTDENLETILMAAIEDGRFDVILLAYNFVNADIAEKILDACEKKDIATIIMKSNPVYILDSLETTMGRMAEKGKEPDKYTQAFYDKYKQMNEGAQHFFAEYGITDEKELKDAASRYVLSNPKAQTTLWNFENFDDMENILKLSGQKLSEKDNLVLGGYHKHLGHTACRIGCNDCEAACPHHLPVNKILRYNYYFSVKKQEKRAMTKFARLNTQKPSDLCSDCEGYCEKACKYGVWTRPLLVAAQNNLDFVV